MPIRNARPVPFRPSGLTDAVDMLFEGSCMNLQNLVFDRINRGAVIPRPGVVQSTTFGGFTTPGVVSVAVAVGTRIYGLIASGKNAGHDEPFAYETSTNSFIAVGGTVSAATTPATQVTTGDWTPPTMDVIGTKVVVTHPGFPGGAGAFFGWFDISNPASPTWNAGNTATNPLPSVPLWVRQFGGRAYYGCGNLVYCSDALAATTIGTTAINGLLTLGDTSATTGACGLPLNTSSGGILQSLIVFKGNTVFQITGDVAANTLAQNTLSNAVGCISPRSAAQTPAGVAFIATDGPRVVNLAGELDFLRRADDIEPDLVSPFAAATYPSRICAAYNNSTYRVGFDVNWTIWNSVYTSMDVWFDMMFGRWNGPHTFPYHVVIPVGSTFYIASNAYPGILFKSDAVLSASTVYTDNTNGTPSTYNCKLTSCATKASPEAKGAIVESTIELCSLANSVSYYMTVFDDQNNPLAPATISLKTPTPQWTAVKWAQFNWRASQLSSHAFQIPWVNPIVFDKMIFEAQVQAAQYVSMKTVVHRVQELGYEKT